MNKQWTIASLRITSEVLTPEQISDKLGTQPTKVARRGELSSKRNTSSSRRTVSTWLLNSTLDQSAPVEDHLDHLIDVVEGHKSQLAALEGIELDIVLSYRFSAQGGLYLSVAILERMVGLGVGLGMDMYSDDG
jgi:hypothetical protein